MNSKTVYQTDAYGVFVGITSADESPLEPGVFLIPAGCVEVKPPKFDANTQLARFVEGKWLIEAIPAPEPEPEPEPPQPGPPSVVTMRQARLALLKAGLLEQVNTAIASLQGAEGEAARIEWEYSQEIWRNRPFVILLGDTLGLSAKQIDDLFIEAATL